MKQIMLQVMVDPDDPVLHPMADTAACNRNRVPHLRDSLLAEDRARMFEVFRRSWPDMRAIDMTRFHDEGDRA